MQRRRTFGIISHPDAGKTTLTEKLLLFSGAIQMAGTVKARKSGRHATSDWMEIEKQRGISVASSVMQFEFRDHVINLLDTPGHQDFSEDTYRVLTAVDSALMVIDAAKGVEAQTIKLLDVCRMRDTPIVTFMNKMDRETRDPLELLDELESVLKIECAPVTWPIGMGKNFRGVYHLLNDEIMLFKAGEEKADGAFEIIKGIDNPRLQEMFPLEIEQLKMEVELVHGASHPFDLERFLAGVQTPVFFGSAINNFGVREILSALVDWAPAPRERDATVRAVEAGRAAVHRLRLQDPGEHGPGPPRPHRLPARVLGALRAGHEGQAPAPGPRNQGVVRRDLHGVDAASRSRKPTPATSSACPTTAICRSATAFRKASC